MAATESNRRNVSLKNPALPFRGDSQRYPICGFENFTGNGSAYISNN